MSNALSMSKIGEKALIRDFIKPLFNAGDDPHGVGDDCAIVQAGNECVLLSTDRVPADLVAFRLGILDHEGLGDYLARLNVSDIAACGGRPVGLLLNLGLPATMDYEDVKDLCRGVKRQAVKCGCEVIGGDITSSSELSISATSIGLARRGQVLMRRGAKAGDSIFLSRPVGMTPAAFVYFLGGYEGTLSEEDIADLQKQFTGMAPMLELGRRLGASGLCTSCMDNTDGIGQSMSELAEASRVGFVVDGPSLTIPPLVARVGTLAGKRPFEYVFNGGADFSLVGTLRGHWNSQQATERFDHPLEIIGHVEAGSGVSLKEHGISRELQFKGWNYFVPDSV